jgi:hypothetical protein
MAMRQDVDRLWPGAPIVDQSRSGRWVRFVAPGDGAAVYLQRRGWDEATRPDYLVVWYGESGDRPVAQRRFGDLADAVAEVRGYWESRHAAPAPSD